MRSCFSFPLLITLIAGIAGCSKSDKPAGEISNRTSSDPEKMAQLQESINKFAERTCPPTPPEQAVGSPAPQSPSKYSERTKQFLEAAEKGRISLMLEFIKQGADVNDKDDDGQTALHKTVAGGHRSAVIVLLTHGADMGERDAKGRTPLMVAAENGQAQLVSILTNPDSVKELAGEALKSVGAEALKAVGLPGFTDRLNKLVASSVDLPDHTGQTPLMKAAANGHLDVVKALESRSDLSRRDRQGKTALMLAAAAGDAPMVEHLASFAQLTTEKIQATDKDGKTALDLATAAGRKDVVLVLRQATLLKAAGESQMALVRDILEHKDGPALNATEALKAAARNGGTAIVRYFMEKWKDKPIEERQRLLGMPVKGYDGTALALASINGHKQTVEVLLDVTWWKDKTALLDYITAPIYGISTVEKVYGQSGEMVAYLKARREALEAELKK
ncbi:MAG TPA: ankyrin repeat domain-containing protein [Gemmataceae bacterium]|nr:ankyrin repeat domain-containing protein [Gemmataceae bacterium]